MAPRDITVTAHELVPPEIVNLFRDELLQACVRKQRSLHKLIRFHLNRAVSSNAAIDEWRQTDLCSYAILESALYTTRVLAFRIVVDCIEFITINGIRQSRLLECRQKAVQTMSRLYTIQAIAGGI